MTKVIFRKWENSIIALFPDLCYPKYCYSPGCVMSYMHIGQHGEALYLHIISNSKLASPKEYNDLLNELKQIGYDDLKIMKRRYHNDNLIC